MPKQLSVESNSLLCAALSSENGGLKMISLGKLKVCLKSREKKKSYLKKKKELFSKIVVGILFVIFLG